MQEPYFQKYLRLVDPLVPTRDQLVSQQERFIRWAKCLDADCTTILHKPYTWTLSEVLKHLSDCERVFAYRALWLARGSGGELPSFDEMAFAANAAAKEISWQKLTEEFLAVRSASIWLFENLPSRGWLGSGRAAGFDVDVRMLCAMICGHFDHHFDILQQRRSGIP